MSEIKFHALAALFPMLPAEGLRALSADIRDHGLHTPIMTFEGKILDGRNRYRAWGKF
jgi:ParB-like chromosome segregation protein Spo0J